MDRLDSLGSETGYLSLERPAEWNKSLGADVLRGKGEDVSCGGWSRASICGGAQCLVSRTGLVGVFRLDEPIVTPCGFFLVYDFPHVPLMTTNPGVEYSASRHFDPCAYPHSQAPRV